MIIEGRSFPSLSTRGQAMLFLLCALLFIALGLSVADRNITRDNPAWIDPAQEAPPTDTAIIGLYLLNGYQHPIRVKMFYNFNDDLGKMEWWQLDNDSAQHNMGRPYRWTKELIVPDMLLWASRNGRK